MRVGRIAKREREGGGGEEASTGRERTADLGTKTMADQLQYAGRVKFYALKLEDLIGQLGHSVGLVVSKLLSDLGHGTDHGRGSAKQDLHVCSGLGNVFLDHVRVHEANTTSPALRRVVQHIVHLELRMLLGQQVKLSLQDDILLVDISEDQADLSLVLWILDNCTNDLKHGSKSSTTSNHTNSTAHVGSVVELSLRATGIDRIAKLKLAEHFGDVALRVRLDAENKVSQIITATGRSVAARDLLSVDIRHDGDVLADRQVQDVVLMWESKLVHGSIWAAHNLVNQLELAIFLGIQWWSLDSCLVLHVGAGPGGCNTCNSERYRIRIDEVGAGKNGA